MRRNGHRRLALIAVVVGAMMLTGCYKDDEEVAVDESQLVGLWVKSGSQEYWRYRTDHTGITWDKAENISEEESNLAYRWSVSGAVLTHTFTGAEGNQAVPKVYTITGISSQSMQWEDDYGMSYRLSKVAEK